MGEDSGFQLEKFTLSVKIQRYVYHYVYYTEMCVVRMHNPSIALGNEILYYIEGWPYLRGVFVMYLGLSYGLEYRHSVAGIVNRAIKASLPCVNVAG